MLVERSLIGFIRASPGPVAEVQAASSSTLGRRLNVQSPVVPLSLQVSLCCQDVMDADRVHGSWAGLGSQGESIGGSLGVGIQQWSSAVAVERRHPVPLWSTHALDKLPPWHRPWPISPRAPTPRHCYTYVTAVVVT
jgi:hypothetical protein